MPPTSRRSNPIGTGTVTFNSDGTLEATSTARPRHRAPSTLTIPWAATLGLAAQTIAVNLGSVDGAAGLTQYDTRFRA